MDALPSGPVVFGLAIAMLGVIALFVVICMATMAYTSKFPHRGFYVRNAILAVCAGAIFGVLLVYATPPAGDPVSCVIVCAFFALTALSMSRSTYVVFRAPYAVLLKEREQEERSKVAAVKAAVTERTRKV